MRHIMEAVVAGNFIASRRADDLGHMRVHVMAGQLVAGGGEWIEYHFLGETVAQLGPAVLAGQGGEIIKGFLYAAELDIEDALHMGLVPLRRPAVHPAAHAL